MSICEAFVPEVVERVGISEKRNTFGLEEKSYKGPSKKTGKAVIE